MLRTVFRCSLVRASASVLSSYANITQLNSAVRIAQLSTSAVANAGHSHWQNIKKQKTEYDRAKAIQFGRHSVSIKIAIREGNSANPEVNSMLAEAIKRALADGMPKSSIQRVLERMSSKSGVLAPSHYEVKLASGAYAVVEAITNRPVMTRSLLISMSKKYGFQCIVDSAQSSARRLFDHCGVVRVLATDKIPNLDAATELAIQVGANDVHEVEIAPDDAEEEEPQSKGSSRTKAAAAKAAKAEPAAPSSGPSRGFEFICEPLIVSQVRNKLEAQGLMIRSAEDEFRPTTVVSVTPAFYQTVTEFYRKMSDNIDEVERVFDNLEVGEAE